MEGSSGQVLKGSLTFNGFVVQLLSRTLITTGLNKFIENRR